MAFLLHTGDTDRASGFGVPFISEPKISYIIESSHVTCSTFPSVTLVTHSEFCQEIRMAFLQVFT